ncbi:hypothetical protein AA0312_0081 [Acetobacter tropicalis NRIC 0312]|uniref:Sulfotransferase domain-containing protein n=2 Tax=Acetobacter tropicalis TaxID=104102 RepID=A0A511FIS1_9PROT|nr:sulfotransferase [Acetobacter tropicalis]GBR66803.1 hypothetical protein AA0312_0081 [Acetobacter tropicalis NRIC 0312]GEL49136.1 hypothetical protein ATR01nite_02110 [Acetobacter tropicalis]
MRFVFILGSPFCGSTAVGNMLNSHEHIFHAGEVDRLAIFSRYRNHDAHLTVNGCSLCSLQTSINNCTVWNNYPTEPLESKEKIVSAYYNLAKNSKKEIILDSSKNADWLTLLWEGGLDTCSSIILSRNPFSFAYSHFKATGFPFWQGIEVWRNIYDHCLRVVLSRGIPLLSLKHSDLLNDADNFFSKILYFLQLSGSVDYNHFYQYPCHALGGNVGSFLKYPNFNFTDYLNKELKENRNSTIQELFEKNLSPASPTQRSDDAWLRHLSTDDIASGLSLPGVVDTMTLLGYNPAKIVYEKIEWDNNNSK